MERGRADGGIRTGALGTSGLMERVCEHANLQAELKRVRKNKGSAGIDGMTAVTCPLGGDLFIGVSPSALHRCADVLFPPQ